MATKETVRDKTIQIRVTPEEYEIIEDKSKKLGLTISNYVRLVSMYTKINIELDQENKNNI